MTDKETLVFDNKNLHMEPFSFTYNSSLQEFISGSSDCLIKFLPINEMTARETVDENKEVSSIHYSDDKIFYSQSKNLEMAKLNSEGIFKVNESILLTTFASNIKQILYNSKYHCVIAFSEDDDLTIVNIDDMKVYQYKTTNEVSLKYMCNSPDNEYLLTAGCDGNLSIYQYSSEESSKGSVSFKNKLFGFTKTTIEDKKKSNCFDINEDNVCILSGDILLKYFTIDIKNSEIKTEPAISHNANINVVKWIKKSSVLTCDVDNKINIWNFDNKTCIYNFEPLTISNSLPDIFIVFPNKEKENEFKIVYGDEEGSINISAPLTLKEEDNQEHEKEFDMIVDEVLNDIKDEKAESKKEEKEGDKKSEKILNLSDIEDEEGNILKKDEIEQRLQEKKEMEKEEGELNINTIRDQLRICELQEPFIASSTIGDGIAPRYLCCNLTGRIISRNEATFKVIDIIFSDTTNKKNISFIDTNEYHLATMNNVGAIFGNKIEEENLGEYEKENRRKESTIEFKSVQMTTTSLINDWSVKLSSEENPLLLAIGSDWCCAYTSMGFLRVYSIFGGEKYKFSVNTNILCMTGYENYLAYAYHVSLPFSNTQQLRFKILDSNKMFNEIYDDELSISPESNLIWFGFSEEGVLISYDSYNILRGFFVHINSNWVPLLDLGEKYSGTNINYWVVGVDEGEVYGIEMKGDAIEPPAFPRPIQKTYKFIKSTEENWDERDCNNNYYMILFYEKRYLNYNKIRDIRSSNFPEYYFTDFLKDESDIKKMKKEHDKKLLTDMNEFIIKGENSKVINYFDFLFLKKSKEILINICKEYNQRDLEIYLTYKYKMNLIINAEPKLQIIAQETNIKTVHKEEKTENKNNSNLKNLEDIAINLSAFQNNELVNTEIKKNQEDTSKKEGEGIDENEEKIDENNKDNNTSTINTNLNIFTKKTPAPGGHDLFNDLSKLNVPLPNKTNNLQKSGSKVGFKRNRKELLNAALPFEREIINNSKKMKK